MSAYVSFNQKNITSDPILEEVTSLKFTKNDLDKRIYSFSQGVFDIIFRLGRVQTKPFHLVVERFQTLRYQEKNLSLLIKIRMLALVIICIPAAVIATPGAVMQAFANKFNKNFYYSPSSPQPLKFKDSKQQKSSALTFMTWNTGLGPGFISIDNRLKKPLERVDAVVETIKNQNPSVVALQELFDVEATEAVVKKLNDMGYDCIHSILSNSALGLSSGLLLAVKRDADVQMKIEEIKVWKFKNLVGLDQISNKGLLGVKIKISSREGTEKILNVFTTHLQASYDEAGYGEVRQAQISAMVDKINAWASKSDPLNGVVVCGDFNFGFQPLEKADAKKLIPLHPSSEFSGEDNEYIVQMNELARANLFDPNQAAQDGKQGSFYDLKQGAPYKVKSVVDYILVNESLKNAIGPSEIIELDVKNLPSDHSPVVQHLELPSQ